VSEVALALLAKRVPQDLQVLQDRKDELVQVAALAGPARPVPPASPAAPDLRDRGANQARKDPRAFVAGVVPLVLQASTVLVASPAAAARLAVQDTLAPVVILASLANLGKLVRPANEGKEVLAGSRGQEVAEVCLVSGVPGHAGPGVALARMARTGVISLSRSPDLLRRQLSLVAATALRPSKGGRLCAAV